MYEKTHTGAKHFHVSKLTVWIKKHLIFTGDRIMGNAKHRSIILEITVVKNKFVKNYLQQTRNAVI
jgi:hypothetical protein